MTEQGDQPHEPRPTTGVVVVAAGSGARLGGAVPKAFAQLQRRTLLDHCLLQMSGIADEVVVAVPADFVELVASTYPDAHVVAGGPTRQASVAAALAVMPDVDVVLVHDAARPLTPPFQYARVRDAVARTGSGVVPVLPVADTLKAVGADSAVLGTVDRAPLRAAQTPQGFPAARLRAAYAAAAHEYTDDAALYAAAGEPVVTIEGHAEAFKITVADDLVRARGLLPASQRVGVGVDVHAVEAGRPMWLAGLFWPDEAGLAGHSDGDAVCHAIADALLSAAGVGDLGSEFGVDRPEEAGRAGIDFVTRAADRIRAEEFAPVNVAVQVIGLRPKLAARRREAEELLSRAVGAPVSLSGTTSDGLGFTGRGEGVTAIATALVRG